MKQHNNMKLVLKKTLLPTIFIIMISCSLLIGCSNDSKSKKNEISAIDVIETSDNKVRTLTDKDTLY